MVKGSLDEADARAIAEEDAKRAYRDLAPYEVRARYEKGAWHIDYELRPGLNGGGPHYVIDAASGRILSKRYEQ
jgi:hypothetical protein